MRRIWRQPVRGTKKQPDSIRRREPRWEGERSNADRAVSLSDYKKHTLRLWLRQYRRAVLLVPLVTRVAPANDGEGGFLKPSVIYCHADGTGRRTSSWLIWATLRRAQTAA
jgi:hypothetical protein